MASCCQHDNAVCSLHWTEASGHLPTQATLYLVNKSLAVAEEVRWSLEGVWTFWGGGGGRHMFCSYQQSNSYSSGRPACNPWVQPAARCHICNLYIYIYICKLKWSLYRPGVAQRIGRVIALLFHDHGSRRGWVVSSTPRPHFTPGKDPVPILQEGGLALGPVWTGGTSRPHRDSIPDRPARSSVAIPTELPGPKLYIYIYIYIYTVKSCTIIQAVGYSTYCDF